MKIGIVGELEGVHVVLKDSNDTDSPEVKALTQADQVKYIRNHRQKGQDALTPDPN